MLCFLAREPKISKTLPLDGVTLTVSFLFILSHLHQGAESLSSNVQISSCCLARLLLERMKHVDRFFESRKVKQPVCAFGMNSNLANAWANRRHRLPVVRIESLLRLPQLKAGQPANEGRKCPDIHSRTAEPNQRFVRHSSSPGIQVSVCAVKAVASHCSLHTDASRWSRDHSQPGHIRKVSIMSYERVRIDRECACDLDRIGELQTKQAAHPSCALGDA